MKNAMNITKNTVSATYLPYAAYKSALALATAHKGEIGKTDNGNFKATFSSAKVAKKFVAEWTAEYNANRKVEPTVAPTPKAKPSEAEKALDKDVWKFYELAEMLGIEVTEAHEDAISYARAQIRNAQKSTTSKPTATKGKTTSSTKKPTAPRKAKGNAFDFSTIKGKTNSDKNRALHAMLVSMGMKDSRTAEYQAIWNARPWAK